MRPFVVLAGLVLVALGAAGVRYAPAIVAAQHRESMTPFEDEPIADDERIRLTRGVGVLFVLVGLGLFGYGLEAVG